MSFGILATDEVKYVIHQAVLNVDSFCVVSGGSGEWSVSSKWQTCCNYCHVLSVPQLSQVYGVQGLLKSMKIDKKL